MEKGKRKSGLVIGLIIFGVLALGSIVSSGIAGILDDSETTQIASNKPEEKKTETATTSTQSAPEKADYNKQFKKFTKKTSSILPEDSKIQTILLKDNVLEINKEFKMTGLEGSIEKAFELNINVRFFYDMEYIKENLKDVPFNTLNYNYYYKSSETNQYKKMGELSVSRDKLLNFNFDSYNDRELLKLFEVKGEMDFKVLVKNYIED